MLIGRSLLQLGLQDCAPREEKLEGRGGSGEALALDVGLEVYLFGLQH